MARMILLGVGTAVPDQDRGHTHMVWDGPGGPLLIDAGGSTYQRLLQAGIEPTALAAILITHSHADHINGLPALLFSMCLAGRTAPLPIYALPETISIVTRLLDAFELEQYTVQPAWRPINASDQIALDAGWSLTTAPTQHTRPCVALRFSDASGQRVLTYSADTAPYAPVQQLAQGSRVLIHEATDHKPTTYHTTPREAGNIAQQAGAERLVLVHYSPRWTMPEAVALAEVQAGGFTGTAEIGHEQQVIEI